MEVTDPLSRSDGQQENRLDGQDPQGRLFDRFERRTTEGIENQGQIPRRQNGSNRRGLPLCSSQEVLDQRMPMDGR